MSALTNVRAPLDAFIRIDRLAQRKIRSSLSG